MNEAADILMDTSNQSIHGPRMDETFIAISGGLGSTARLVAQAGRGTCKRDGCNPDIASTTEGQSEFTSTIITWILGQRFFGEAVGGRFGSLVPSAPSILPGSAGCGCGTSSTTSAVANTTGTPG